MKAATPPLGVRPPTMWISIHAAREGGDCQGLLDAWLTVISIHAAREGGDIYEKIRKYLAAVFQSTPPVKAATRQDDTYRLDMRHFNPRRP